MPTIRGATKRGIRARLDYTITTSATAYTIKYTAYAEAVSSFTPDGLGSTLWCHASVFWQSGDDYKYTSLRNSSAKLSSMSAGSTKNKVVKNIEKP